MGLNSESLLSTAMAKLADFESLPGGALVKRGAEDLNAERESVEALLVSIGYNALIRRLVSFERAAACAS
jgi:hypothetical protein